MYPAGLCERWAGFFWQLPLLVYIIWLNSLPLTSLAPCYTTCGIRERPPSHTHIMQPPPSVFSFLTPPPHLLLHHLHLFFYFSPTVFLSIPSPHPISPLFTIYCPSFQAMQKHLLPVTCCVQQCLCVLSYPLDSRLFSQYFTGATLYPVESMKLSVVRIDQITGVLRNPTLQANRISPQRFASFYYNRF